MNWMVFIKAVKIDRAFSEFSVKVLRLKKYAGGIEMKIWITALLTTVLWTMAALPVMAQPPKVSETIFEWVQSSSRANYYFNKQQICYAVDDKGMIDLNTIIVPTLKTYDDVQIQDIKDKRRWKMLPMKGFENLAAEAEYLQIDLSRQIVTTVEQDLLDTTWTPLEKNMTPQETDLAKLPAKSWERSFLQAVIDYAAKHQEELIGRTQGKLKAEDQK